MILRNAYRWYVAYERRYHCSAPIISKDIVIARILRRLSVCDVAGEYADVYKALQRLILCLEKGQYSHGAAAAGALQMALDLDNVPEAWRGAARPALQNCLWLVRNYACGVSIDGVWARVFRHVEHLWGHHELRKIIEDVA